MVIAFRGILRTEDALALLYLVTLAFNVLFAAAFAADWMRRGHPQALGGSLGRTAVALTAFFVVVVGFLGLYGLLAVEGMRGLNGGIFPEHMSMFTLRSFGAFYLALALAAFPHLLLRGRDNLLTHGFAQYGLIVLITLAALVFIGQFDFAARPTQLIYIGIYVLVGAIVGFHLVRQGTGTGGDA